MKLNPYVLYVSGYLIHKNPLFSFFTCLLEQNNFIQIQFGKFLFWRQSPTKKKEEDEKEENISSDWN